MGTVIDVSTHHEEIQEPHDQEAKAPYILPYKASRAKMSIPGTHAEK